MPSLDKWLANDTSYKSTVTALQKALADYRARMNQQLGQYDTEYNQNVGNLTTSRRAAQNDSNNDFAGRGLMRSSMYANNMSDLASDYNARQNSLDTGRANFRADTRNAYDDFQTERNLALEQARKNAIQRRAAQYGI